MSLRRLELLAGLMQGLALVSLTLALLLHGYTTFVAFESAGTAAALATLVLPVVAEVYWIVSGAIDGELFWLLLLGACMTFAGTAILLPLQIKATIEFVIWK